MADPTYATLDDVNRILGYDTGADTNRDAKISASLAAINSWLSRVLPGIGVTSPDDGVTTGQFFDVAEDATLHTDPEDAVVTAVRGFRRGLEWDIPLVESEDAWTPLHTGTSYETTPDGDVLLRRNPSVSPFEGAIAERQLAYYDRVEVDYTSVGTIPKAVTEGAAYLCAGTWKNTARILSGIVQEKIGDYEYRTEGAIAGVQALGGDPTYIRTAMWWLTPFMRKVGRVSVT